MNKQLLALTNSFDSYRENFASRVHKIIGENLEYYSKSLKKKNSALLNSIENNIFHTDWGVTLDIIESALIKAKCEVYDTNYDECDNSEYKFNFDYNEVLFTCIGNTEIGSFTIYHNIEEE